MKTSPVSFGSIMVFTINDEKPKANTGDMVKTSFRFNSDLSSFYVLESRKFDEVQIDGSVHNAAPSFCKMLDKRYEHLLPKGSNKVILTEADFFVNSNELQKRYFVTASRDKDEKYIQRILGHGFYLFAAKFYEKE